MPDKPLMFIAEDSRVLDRYEKMFSPRFTVISASTGTEAFGLLAQWPSIDICLLDIVMPVESENAKAEDAVSTGIRLLRKIIDGKKSKRILIVTVRNDIEDEVASIVRGQAECVILNKRDSQNEDICDAVQKLMEAGGKSEASRKGTPI